MNSAVNINVNASELIIDEDAEGAPEYIPKGIFDKDFGHFLKILM